MLLRLLPLLLFLLLVPPGNAELFFFSFFFAQVALRGYGVVFAVVVVVTELSEFDLGVWGKKLLGSCHANPVAQQW